VLERNREIDVLHGTVSSRMISLYACFVIRRWDVGMNREREREIKEGKEKEKERERELS